MLNALIWTLVWSFVAAFIVLFALFPGPVFLAIAAAAFWLNSSTTEYPAERVHAAQGEEAA